MNDRGEYFPLWGTCLGFELLMYLGNNNTEPLVPCAAESIPLSLDFKYDFKDSRLFTNAPQVVIDILSSEKVTANFHHYCVTEDDFKKFGLDQDWTVISTNKDKNGLDFISTVEHKKYPYYGVQYHPEKNLYEWYESSTILHTANAVQASQYFAQFFIEESRKSLHKFKTAGETNRFLIYNFPAYFTGRNESAFLQTYVFDDTTGDAHLDKLD